MASTNPVARAFELAREGRCHSIEDIRRCLKAERFENVDGHLAGVTIKRQLLDLLKPA